MQPLVFLQVGEEGMIRCVGGAEETRRFLANLGFVENSPLQVVSSSAGNMIINIKNSRVALNKDMAKRIMV